MYLKLTFHKCCLNQKYLEIGSLRPIFKSHLKSSSYLHINQDGCETSGMGFFLRKWPKTRVFTYFGAQRGPKNWISEAQILPTFKSAFTEHVQQYWCETSENFFENITKDLNFCLFWGRPKWPKNWASDAYIPNSAARTCNDHVKQY